MAITFHFEEVSFSLRNRGKLKTYIIQLFGNEGIKTEAIHYIFCTDAMLLSLNKQYLDHDTYTDILTFDLSEDPKRKVADIYISIERVTENSLLYQTSFEKELHRVIFHGVLHLCGYRDHSEKEKRVMRHKENEHLLKYFDS